MLQQRLFNLFVSSVFTSIVIAKVSKRVGTYKVYLTKSVGLNSLWECVRLLEGVLVDRYLWASVDGSDRIDQ